MIVTIVTSCVNALSEYECPVSKDSFRDAVASNMTRLLREEREKRGLSMNVVAQRAGLSHSIVSLVERDLRNPTLDTLLRIAEVLELDLWELIQRAEAEAARKRKQ
jgi:ribosome-binding protein aMBF1 (putative translation factor)